MNAAHRELPRPFGRIFRWLFPTTFGTEVCEELNADFRRVRAHHRGLIPLFWCVAQLLRPSTWLLAWSLRSAQRTLRAQQPARPGGIGTAVPVSWVDVRLAFRMLRKYPVLTAVSVLSISVAVGTAAGFFAFSKNLLDPMLPLEAPDRLVGIQNWNVVSGRPSYRSLHDFGEWRAQLESVHELGAFERFQPNLVLPDGHSEPVLASRITAGGLGVAHVAPILGRPLVRADESAAPEGDVMVIGFDVWQRVFRGDSTVLGRVVRLGARRYTIVGVMPEGFRFPFNDDLWVPLHDDPMTTGPLEGPFIFVVGRLSDGASRQQAQTEVGLLSRRIAAQHPNAYASLRARVQPFAQSMNGRSTARWGAGRVILLLLLIVVCANVGALIYARNASRVSEVTIRQALGASRTRILAQLLVESLLLAVLGAAAGLVLARWGIAAVARIVMVVQSGGTVTLPYWWQWNLAPDVLWYVAGLTLIGAVVAGLLPALRLTRPAGDKPLTISPRGGVAPPVGRSAKLMTALQVGVSVGLLAVAVGRLPSLVRMNRVTLNGVVPTEYLTADLQPAEVPPSERAFHEAISQVWHDATTLKRRLTEEPDVRAATLASRFPGMSHPQRMAEADGGRLTTPAPVRVASIQGDFFETLGTPLFAGRTFGSGDVASDSTAQPVAIVNRSFMRRFLGDGKALGRRVRFVTPGSEPGPWLEVVGVVADLDMNISDPDSPEGLYLPLAARTLPVMVGVRTYDDARASFRSRLRAIAAEVDPSLRVMRIRALDEIVEGARTAERWAYLGILFSTLAALALSVTGVYAVTSFLVTQRTREIGIRVALGASRQQIAFSIVSRALVPAMAGMVLGALSAIALDVVLGLGSAWTTVSVSIAIFGAILLACWSPARRAMAIPPSEAIQTGV